MATGAELTYTTNASAMAMANAIFGSGVTVRAASYSGPNNSSAIYSNGQRSPSVVPSENGVILSTGNVRDFTQSSGDPNRSTGTSTDTNGFDNTSDFNAIAGTNTYDAVWLDVDFTPAGNTLTMSFVFASEEFPEYINSQFNDVVGVWVNGSHVPISVGSGRTSVNNINGTTQQNLFVNNTNDAYNTEMDGFTVTLTLTMPVIAGTLNSIRIGIADAADANYDSNLLIGGDSLQTTLVALDDSMNLNPNGVKTLDVLANDIRPSGATLTITHINGIAVTVGSTITLPSGQTVKLNADGTFTITGDGQVETKNFTYTVSDGLGHTDTGFVKINSIPCFVAGTAIRTPYGEVPVETLLPGDLVMTQDDGPQPLRWIGRRTVAAIGNFAPVHIRAGTFGQHRDLMVSPLHRILIRDSLSELLFGESEVLVAAKDLVNDRSVRYVTGGQVEYVHLLFDRHQVVFSEGLATESFLPGPQTAKSFEADIVTEICAIFPEIDPETGHGYSPAARRTLRTFEARLLFALGRAA
ncbi:Hint domain-containing protein [Pseudorhodobacter ferrugineus]|uniref:Hint domain-containing protein n=1 Tax=Pseudorhodobacter ferrugineus TaxID=77008 RepID=UPI0003B34C5A|nr:Hint domain-containing protein [Pseudorhodobacter ferrugineus]